MSRPPASIATLARGAGPSVAALAVAILALGCGGSREPDPAARALVLTPLEGGPVARARVVRTIEVPAEAGTWAVQAERARLREPRGSGPRALELFGAGEKRVLVPGRFRPVEVQRVRLRFRMEGDDHLAVWLRRGESVAVRSRSLRVQGTGEPQELDVDLPLDPRDDAEFDGLMVHAYGTARGLALLGLELLTVPTAARLPDVRDGASAIRLGWEERLGLGLVAGRPLVAEFRARAGEELVFSYGRLPDVLGPEEPAGIRLVLDAGGSPGVHRFALPARGWSHARVPLEHLAGRDVQARFELDGPADAVAPLGEPWIVLPRESAPLVLLVTSDTHRGDHLGAAEGDVEVETPTLDGLAARGVFFTDCFSSANFTIPSHSALFTGLTPRDTGVIDNYGRLSERAETLAERFREAGWLTMASVSARLLESGGLGQGFERLAMPEQPNWNAALAADPILRWLPDASGRPTFVWLHLFDAHRPYQPPDETYDRKYWPDGLDPADPSAPPQPLPPEFLEANAPGLRRIGFFEAQYRAEVDYLDAVLGRLLVQPRFADAIVAVTADHGESLGQHGIWWTHEGLYPDTLHVPLILAWPDAPRGKRIDAPVRQVDLGPTLLELAGLPTEGLAAESLLRTIRDGGSSKPRFALSNDAFSASITSGGWHLILNLRDHHPEGVLEPRVRHRTELYDLANDPECTADLATIEAKRAGEMRAGLIRWLAEAPSAKLSARGPADQETRDEIAALGYAEGASIEDSELLVDPECGCMECAGWR